MKPIIEVKSISKQYKIGKKQKYLSLRDSVSDFFKLKNQNTEGSDFWALDDVSFEVQAGESIGIIGRNGAGKSTLLKILSRITPPTKGSVILRGRVASLLEVGTGFHQELSGRENVFMNGSILGLRRAEITQKFDEIVAFSGVEPFIYTPLKHYSSGMQLRLAFAVAAHLEPEILIIDEVLAVGDAEFQKKCLGKMDEVSKSGRTIIFVSHNMDALIKLCSRGLILTNGKADSIKPIQECISYYLTSKSLTDIFTWVQNKEPKKLPFFSEVCIKLTGSQPYKKLYITFEIKSYQPFIASFIAVNIENNMSVSIMQAIPTLLPIITLETIEKKFKMEIDLIGLVPGLYSISLWMGPHNTTTYDWQKNILQFNIFDSPTIGRTFPHSFENGYIVPNSVISIA